MTAAAAAGCALSVASLAAAYLGAFPRRRYDPNVSSCMLKAFSCAWVWALSSTRGALQPACCIQRLGSSAAVARCCANHVVAATHTTSCGHAHSEYISCMLLGAACTAPSHNHAAVLCAWTACRCQAVTGCCCQRATYRPHTPAFSPSLSCTHSRNTHRCLAQMSSTLSAGHRQSRRAQTAPC